MLKLTYRYENDRFKTVTVLGDAEGIRDLFWQLTRNYKAQDGCGIGYINISNLDGEILEHPTSMDEIYTYDSGLSNGFV